MAAIMTPAPVSRKLFDYRSSSIVKVGSLFDDFSPDGAVIGSNYLILNEPTVMCNSVPMVMAKVIVFRNSHDFPLFGWVSGD